MYKCLECGNTEKFYGIAKERGNALIFQNCGEFNGNGSKSKLEDALDRLRRDHDRSKQSAGSLKSYPDTVCVDSGERQISDPGPGTIPCKISDTNILTKVPYKEDDLALDNKYGKDSAGVADPASIIRGNLWAIQDDNKGEDVSWAYIMSDKGWKGFHEVRSCAACHSTNIADI